MPPSRSPNDTWDRGRIEEAEPIVWGWTRLLSGGLVFTEESPYSTRNSVGWCHKLLSQAKQSLARKIRPTWRFFPDRPGRPSNTRAGVWLGGSCGCEVGLPRNRGASAQTFLSVDILRIDQSPNIYQGVRQCGIVLLVWTTRPRYNRAMWCRLSFS